MAQHDTAGALSLCLLLTGTVASLKKTKKNSLHCEGVSVCLVNNVVLCLRQDHGLYSKERVEEQPRPPVKANDYSSSSESSESSEESESGEGQEEESPTDRYGRSQSFYQLC